MKERIEILKDLWEASTMSEKAMGIAISMIIIVFFVNKLIYG
jgi:hypothetical protein